MWALQDIDSINFDDSVSIWLEFISSAFSSNVQLFKTSLFLIFLTFSKYKYTLAHFQQKVFKKKKLNRLFLNEHQVQTR